MVLTRIFAPTQPGGSSARWPQRSWPLGTRRPSDPAEGSRRALYKLEEGVQRLCHHFALLDSEIRSCSERLSRLREQFPDYSRNPGKHLSTAVLISLLPVVSWGLDFIVLSPLIDYLLSWSGLADEASLPLRIVGSVLWASIGYAIGTYGGLSLEQRRSGVLWWVVVLVYVPAMPILAYATASMSTDLQGLHAIGMFVMAATGSLIPIIMGPLSSDAKDYLIFLGKHSRLQRHIPALKARQARIGFEAERQLGLLLREGQEHQRRFQEAIAPQYDELTRRILNEVGQGRLQVDLQEPDTNGARPDAEAPSAPSREAPRTDRSQNGTGEDAAQHYTRSLQEQEANRMDAALHPEDGSNPSLS